LSGSVRPLLLVEYQPNYDESGRLLNVLELHLRHRGLRDLHRSGADQTREIAERNDDSEAARKGAMNNGVAGDGKAFCILAHDGD